MFSLFFVDFLRSLHLSIILEKVEDLWKNSIQDQLIEHTKNKVFFNDFKLLNTTKLNK